MVSKLTQAEIDAIIFQYGGQQEETPAGTPGATPSAHLATAEGEGLSPVAPPRAAPFPALDGVQAPVGGGSSIGLLANVELDVTVRLGKTRRSIREILSLGNGAVLELDSLAGEMVDILVNGRLVAKGEVVVVQENYGVRIVELADALGGKGS